MTTWILAVVGLYLAQVFFAASFGVVLTDDPAATTADHMRGKDLKPEKSIIGGRAQRALDNLKESMPIFLAIALLLHINGTNDGMAQTGAIVFLVGRTLYVPAYLLAVYGLRTLMWSTGLVGMGLMASALF